MIYNIDSIDVDLELCFWKIDETKPYYDDETYLIESYKLQKLGYQGYNVSDYSLYEFKEIKKFASTYGAKIFKLGNYDDRNEALGEYSGNCLIVRTIHPVEFEALLNNLPARNKFKIVKNKVNTKTIKNYKYFYGSENIILSYTDTSDMITIKDYKLFKETIRKLTK